MPKHIAIALTGAAVFAAAAWLGYPVLSEPLGLAGIERGGFLAIGAALGLVVGLGAGRWANRSVNQETDWHETEVEPELEEQHARRRPLHVREEVGLEAEAQVNIARVAEDASADPGNVETSADELENGPVEILETEPELLAAPAPTPPAREPLDGLSLHQLQERLEQAIGEWRDAARTDAPPAAAPQPHDRLRAALERLAALDDNVSEAGDTH